MSLVSLPKEDVLGILRGLDFGVTVKDGKLTPSFILPKDVPAEMCELLLKEDGSLNEGALLGVLLLWVKDALPRDNNGFKFDKKGA